MNYSIMIINRQKIDAAVATLSSAWELNEDNTQNQVLISFLDSKDEKQTSPTFLLPNIPVLLDIICLLTLKMIFSKCSQINSVPKHVFNSSCLKRKGYH